MKNFNKKLTLVVALASIVSCASANAQEQTSTLLERLASPISKFCSNITNIGIKGLTRAVIKVSEAADRHLPLKAQEQVDPQKMAADVTNILVAAGTGAVTIAAQQGDKALADNPDTANTVITDVTTQMTGVLEERAEKVISETVYAWSWHDVVYYTGLAAMTSLIFKERAHFAGKLQDCRRLFSR